MRYQAQKKEVKGMSQIYVGIDIGSEAHEVVVLSKSHEVLKRRKLKHSIRQITEFIEDLRQLAKDHNCSEVMVGMESSNGYAAPMDRMLVGAGFKVIAINSVTIDKYRKLVGQPRKDDKYDAKLIGKYLIDMFHLKGIEKNAQEIKNPEQASLGKLRALTRLYRTTKRELVRVNNRLIKHVLGYFPDFLEEFEDLQTKTARVLLCQFGTLSKAKKAKLTRIANTKISAGRRVGPKAAGRLKVLVNQINYHDPLEEQMGKVTSNLVSQMNWLMEQLDDLALQIVELSKGHSGIQEVASKISGAGLISASELLAEIGDIRRFTTRDKLSIYCGIGCLNNSSGKSEKGSKPTHVNHRAKGVLCMMAQAAIMTHSESRRYYDKKRKEGKSHWHAIKCLAKYLLRHIFTLLNQMEVEDVIYLAA